MKAVTAWLKNQAGGSACLTPKYQAAVLEAVVDFMVVLETLDRRLLRVRSGLLMLND